MSKSSYKVKLKIPEVNAATEQAFKETAFLLGRRFTEVITEPRAWEGWSGARDIVDFGQLRSSQQLVFTQPLEAVFSWPTAYSAHVHEGYTLRNGKKVPGRPWTTVALQEFNVQQTFEERLRRVLG